jgi:hypothetical protein
LARSAASTLDSLPATFCSGCLLFALPCLSDALLRHRLASHQLRVRLLWTRLRARCFGRVAVPERHALILVLLHHIPLLQQLRHVYLLVRNAERVCWLLRTVSRRLDHDCALLIQ